MRHYTTRKYTRAARGTLWTRHPTEVSYRAHGPAHAVKKRGAMRASDCKDDSAGVTWATSADGLTRISARPILGL